MFSKKFIYTFAFILISSVLKLSESAADTCWQGTQGASTAAASAVVSGTTLLTCKRVTSIPAGFGSYASVVGSIVDSSTDSTCSSTNCLTTSTGTLANGCTVTSVSSGATTITFCKNGATAGSGPSSASAAITDVPVLSSCYTAWSTTTYITGTTGAATAAFCKAVYTVGSSSSIASAVTLSNNANNAACVSDTTVGAAGTTFTSCCSVNNCNAVLYCSVGTFAASTGVSTMAATICMPNAGQYCKNTFTYSGGLVVTGTCESACTPASVVITSTTATGTTCCSSGNCNGFTAPKSSANFLKSTINIQLIFLLIGLFMMMINIRT